MEYDAAPTGWNGERVSADREPARFGGVAVLASSVAPSRTTLRDGAFVVRRPRVAVGLPPALALALADVPDEVPEDVDEDHGDDGRLVLLLVARDRCVT